MRHSSIRPIDHVLHRMDVQCMQIPWFKSNAWPLTPHGCWPGRGLSLEFFASDRGSLGSMACDRLDGSLLWISFLIPSEDRSKKEGMPGAFAPTSADGLFHKSEPCKVLLEGVNSERKDPVRGSHVDDSPEARPTIIRGVPGYPTAAVHVQGRLLPSPWVTQDNVHLVVSILPAENRVCVVCNQIGIGVVDFVWRSVSRGVGPSNNGVEGLA